MTLTSTTIGVLLGLYLNNLNQQIKLERGKDAAISQLAIELQENVELLTDYHEKISQQYSASDYLISKMNDNYELIIEADSLDSFIEATQLIFKYSKSDSISENLIKVRGDMDLVLDDELFARDLSRIVWDTYIQTQFVSITNFRCLTDIEALYAFQDDVNALNNEWKDVFLEGQFIVNIEERQRFFKNWKALLTKQALLLKIYKFKDEMLENCQETG